MDTRHAMERQIYDCECGAWWAGDTYPTGLAETDTEECPRCGSPVLCTIEPLD